MLAQCANNSLIPEAVNQLEKHMLQLPQVSCSVIHRFAPGIYIREVSVPAGTIAIGHYQNFEQLNVMLKGRVSVLNDDGSVSELVAPLMFVGKPGRKIGYIHEDMVWQNIYATEETDIDKLEAYYLTKSEDWLINQIECNKLEDLKLYNDREDYFKVLNEFGFTDELARQQSFNAADMRELPFGAYKIKVADSKIEGKGLFATADIKAGEIIAPARIEGKRTIAGRYANHSFKPNAKMIRTGNFDISLIALQNIEGCKGGKDGEEITISYRDALQLNFEIGEVK